MLLISKPKSQIKLKAFYGIWPGTDWKHSTAAEIRTGRFQQHKTVLLIHSLPGQFFPECHPLIGLGFVEVPAGYVLRCRCMAELHVLNDEYTRQWHLLMHIN